MKKTKEWISLKLVSSPAACRLFELSLPVLNNYFGSKYLYMRKNLSKWKLTSADLVYDYQKSIESYIELIALHLKDKKYLERLSLIAEPSVLYAYKCVVDRSAEMLDSPEYTVDPKVPEDDGDFFRKYAGLSIRSFLAQFNR